jgi:integrase
MKITENCRVSLLNRTSRLAPASDADICALTAQCHVNPRLHFVRDVVCTVANLGLSNSEFAAMRFTDIDFERAAICVGRDRSGPRVTRLLPLRPKVRAALVSLHERSSQAPFIAGENPRNQLRMVIQNMRSITSKWSRGNISLHSVRANFFSRLFSSGIPMSAVRYCLGWRNTYSLRNEPCLSTTATLEIIRRDLDSFLPEL